MHRKLHPAGPRRPGFTLVELLVVLGIMMILASLLVLMGPRMMERSRAAHGAELLQQWLLVARQRALRDTVPTGLRLVSGNNGAVTNLLYVQQPPDLTLPWPVSTSSSTPTATPPPQDIVTLGAPAGDPNTFVGDIATQGPPYQSPYQTVQAGDFFYFPGPDDNSQLGGHVHLITSITSPTTLQLLTAGALTVPVANTSNYKIIRGARPVQGEEPLVLPQDIIIDTTTNNTYGNPLPQDQFSGNIDILFSPAGPVMSRGVYTGKIILWVRDQTQSMTADNQTLIVVYTRTGLIAAQQIDLTNTTNPYSFTQDGRASGL